MKYLLLGLFVCFSQFCHGQLKNCFYMDRSSASIDIPCDPDAEVSTGAACYLDWFDNANNLQTSACCQPGWRCVSNLYCLSTTGLGIVGSCTDRSFKDNACPFPLISLTHLPEQVILQIINVLRLIPYLEDLEHPEEVNPVFSYAGNTTICQDGTVCPNAGNETCCSLGVGKKEILFHYIDPMPSDLRALSSIYARAGYSIPSSTTSSSSVAISTSSTSTESSIDRVSASAPSASSKQSTSPENRITNPSSSELSNSAKVGIGVGIGLGVTLLVCVAVFFLRRHRKRNNPVDPLDLTPNASQWPMTAGELHDRSVPAEMDGVGRRPFEMNGESTGTELGTTSRDQHEIQEFTRRSL